MRTRSLFECSTAATRFTILFYTATAPVSILMNEYFLGYHCLMFSISFKLNKFTFRVIAFFER